MILEDYILPPSMYSDKASLDEFQQTKLIKMPLHTPLSQCHQSLEQFTKWGCNAPKPVAIECFRIKPCKQRVLL